MVDITPYMESASADLEDYLRLLFSDASAYLMHTPALLKEAMAYSVFSGGKRLRPILLLTTAESFGMPRQTLLPFAAALECIHTYSLIHDDLPAMDNDDYRRGQLTNHKVYGEAMAILSGDALLTLAFQLTVGESHLISAQTALALVREFAYAAGANGMVGGQVLDIHSARDATRNIEHLEHIHSLKTAMLIQASVKGGGLLGNVSEQQLQSLSAYGFHLGMAFQIKDDLLDVMGDETHTGRPTGSDQRSGKETYVSVSGLENAQKAVEYHSSQAVQSLQPIQSPLPLLESLADYLITRKK